MEPCVWPHYPELAVKVCEGYPTSNFKLIACLLWHDTFMLDLTASKILKLIEIARNDSVKRA